MRKLFKSLALVAVAAMTLSACNKEVEPQQKNEEGLYKYTFSIFEDTRALIGDNNIEWEEGDQVGIIVDAFAGPAEVDVTTSPKTVTISSDEAILPNTTAYAYFPYSEANDTPDRVIISIPSLQNGAAESVMPMAGIPFNIEEAVEANGETNGAIQFLNLGSIVGFKIYSTDENYVNETVLSVSFEANREISGSAEIDLTSINIEDINNDDYSAVENIAFTDGDVTVTVEQSMPVAAADADDITPIKMVIIPGQYYGTVTVTTDAAVYTKALGAEGDAKDFERSGSRNFRLDLNKAEREEIEPYFVKVTSTDALASGKYLIVYEGESVAFDGSRETLDGASNTISVSIEDGIIAATDEAESAVFTLDIDNGTILSASGYYIGVTSYGNGLKQNTEASTYAAQSFEFDENGNAIISISNDSWAGDMILNYNSASGDKRFRYYKNGSQKAIQLYKRVGPEPTIITWTLTGIEITNTPEKLEYIEGETFSTEGMVITATYVDANDDTNTKTEVIDNASLTIEPSGALTVFDTQVSITYNGFTATLDIIVNENVQPGSAANPYTASEAIAAAEALESGATVENVYVKGIVCTAGSISSGSVSYYVSNNGESTNRFEMYKGKYIDGADFTAETNLKVGDYVVAKGTLKYFTSNSGNSQAELDSNNKVVSVFRAPSFSVPGGIYTSAQTLTLTADSGATIYYTTDGSTPTTSSSVYSEAIAIANDMTVKAFAQNGDLASGVVTAEYTINANANDGSLERPFTATDVLGLTSATDVYVAGTIKSITEVSPSYGNATYTITDGTSDVLVYRGKYIGNTSFTNASQIQVNDEVVIFGSIGQYNQTSQVSQGNYLISINGISKVLTLAVPTITT
ncbi:MAG: chitobiase/beta-hexosaminidase C-terminal domain-containing protein, partial [Bacteroidales bacterium]|nr:chitobiase/beta-hexosaminidase C-terminal domain-containing protein [Bacteroidales bacterium]